MLETKFKNTEIGRIPEDWEVKTLKQIGSFSKGAGISRVEAHSGNLPAVRYGELYTLHNDYIKSFDSFISEQVALRSKKINKGDVLFACSGETKEEIAKSASYIGDDVAYAGGDIIILTPNLKVDPIYMGYVTNSKSSIAQKAAKGQGDAVVHISTASLQSLVLPLPSFNEQTNIASALSSVDKLIDDLNQLIEKKKAIKQGAMQQLLTGKQRLKGFTEPWEIVRLEDFGKLQSGGTPSTSRADYWGGDVNWLQSGAVQNCIVYPNAVANTITQLGLRESAACLISPDSVLIAITGATCANVGYLTFESTANQSVVSIEPYNENSAYFMYQKLMRERTRILAMRGGSAQGGVTLRALRSFEVEIPSDTKEQKAIASVLSRMDEDIQSLIARRDKYIAIKQGMMQQLLTGKIRLISIE